MRSEEVKVLLENGFLPFDDIDSNVIFLLGFLGADKFKDINFVKPMSKYIHEYIKSLKENNRELITKIIQK